MIFTKSTSKYQCFHNKRFFRPYYIIVRDKNSIPYNGASVFHVSSPALLRNATGGGFVLITKKNKDKMAKIINTKVSEKADFKIEDGVIRDSSIGDQSKVYIHDMSELKDVKIYGDVDIKHSTIESCKLVNCSVKNSTIHNVDINKDYCVETIENNEIFIPAGFFECEVTIKQGCITAKFRIYNDVWHNFLDFIKDYYKLQGGAH